MERSLSHVSSARKKLLQYEQTVKKQQSQSGYLGRTLSRQYSKQMQSILRQGLEKQQTDRALKRQYSTKGYHTNLSKTPSSSLSHKKLIDLQLSTLNASRFKPLKTSRSNQYDEIKIQTNNQQTSSQADNTYAHNNNAVSVPQFYNDTDEMRSARQNQLMEAKRVKFEFKLISYVCQILIAYGVFIGILYLIKESGFPYFQILLVVAMTLTISPWKASNIVLPLTAIPITIANQYMGLSALSYIQILICYLGTMTFNEKHKTKVLYILVVVVQVLVGLFLLPALYQLLAATKQPDIYFYLFPLVMFLLRSTIQLLYWILGFTETLFLQIPLFVIGLEYGTVMMTNVGEIEFWYLLVFFTLQIINDRTHFFLKVMVNLVRFCYPQISNTPSPDSQKKNNHILPAHWNGFSSINSFHLIACIYLFTNLPLNSSPYTSSFSLSLYVRNTQWYKPLIVWSLVSVYEIMCLLLEKKRQNVLLVGYTKNKWYNSISRGFMLVLGLWMFYIGLGVGSYTLQRYCNGLINPSQNPDCPQ